MKQYSEEHKVSLRTIKGLSARGIDLDNVDLVRAHLTSNSGRRPKNKVDEIKSDSVDLSSLNLPPEFFEARGLDAAIVRLAYLEQVTGRKVAEAIAMNNPREIQNWIKAHDAITTQLRVSEKNSPAILLEKGSVMSKSEVRAGMSRLWQDLYSRLQTIPKRGMQILVGLDAWEIHDELQREIEQALQPFRDSTWREESGEEKPEAA